MAVGTGDLGLWRTGKLYGRQSASEKVKLVAEGLETLEARPVKGRLAHWKWSGRNHDALGFGGPVHGRNSQAYDVRLLQSGDGHPVRDQGLHT